MNFLTKLMCLYFITGIYSSVFALKPKTTTQKAEQTMYNATRFMVEKVSTNGGYLWNYLPDFSRQWGEMEAYETMIWLQHPGTISMGHLFLDAYEVTNNEYYYHAAHKAAAAIIWGQSNEGGWNYMIDFAGDRSLKQWYNTIGKNGWRMEEFQHYYGNSTFDDNTTSDAARFLLRMYLEKFDPAYKPALDKAIDFILKSQYPLGGWPQRYPLMYEFNKQGHPDYSSYYTFNDEVTAQNIHFLIQCYEVLGEERFLDPILRGMNFYLISQNHTGAWGHQYNLDLQPAGARTYEPDALVTSITCMNAFHLLKFYEFTGNENFLQAVPKAIEWLEENKLPENLTENGKYTHPYYIEIETGKPIYVHRKGSNVKYGYYYFDNNPEKLIAHSRGKRNVPLEFLKTEFERISTIPWCERTIDSPLKPGLFEGEGTPQTDYNLNREDETELPTIAEVEQIINSLDKQNRWMAKHVMISNPYIGDGQNEELNDNYSETFVGDITDTSPYRDKSDQEYISIEKYIHNMRLLINFLNVGK